jgi:hypothetical protein
METVVAILFYALLVFIGLGALAGLFVTLALSLAEETVEEVAH